MVEIGVLLRESGDSFLHKKSRMPSFHSPGFSLYGRSDKGA